MNSSRFHKQLFLTDFARQSIATNQYSYKELKAATQKFHKDKKLGEGGFGEVYQVLKKLHGLIFLLSFGLI